MAEQFTSQQQKDIEKAWETKLVRAGMPSEPKPDKGKQALETAIALETGHTSDDNQVMQALFSYWLTVI